MSDQQDSRIQQSLDGDTPEPDPTPQCDICDDDLEEESCLDRWGNVYCRDCLDAPVTFRATCSSEFCDWSYTVEDTEFNRGHVKNRAHQEANHHQKTKEIFDDNPMHRTSVEEVQG